jgi:hypothetical protein
MNSILKEKWIKSQRDGTYGHFSLADLKDLSTIMQQTLDGMEHFPELAISESWVRMRKNDIDYYIKNREARNLE